MTQTAITIVAVEPQDRRYYWEVRQGGTESRESVSATPLWEPGLVDGILPVKTDNAKAMARRLAREEALFAWTSSGANVVAAIQVAERLGPGAKVVTLMADHLKFVRG